jgi:hypothetical protein
MNLFIMPSSRMLGKPYAAGSFTLDATTEREFSIIDNRLDKSALENLLSNATARGVYKKYITLVRDAYNPDKQREACLTTQHPQIHTVCHQKQQRQQDHVRQVEQDEKIMAWKQNHQGQKRQKMLAVIQRGRQEKIITQQRQQLEAHNKQVEQDEKIMAWKQNHQGRTKKIRVESQQEQMVLAKIQKRWQETHFQKSNDNFKF